MKRGWDMPASASSAHSPSSAACIASARCLAACCSSSVAPSRDVPSTWPGASGRSVSVWRTGCRAGWRGRQTLQVRRRQQRRRWQRRHAMLPPHTSTHPAPLGGRTMTMALPDRTSALSTCPPRFLSPAQRAAVARAAVWARWLGGRTTNEVGWKKRAEAYHCQAEALYRSKPSRPRRHSLLTKWRWKPTTARRKPSNSGDQKPTSVPGPPPRSNTTCRRVGVEASVGGRIGARVGWGVWAGQRG